MGGQTLGTGYARVDSCIGELGEGIWRSGLNCPSQDYCSNSHVVQSHEGVWQTQSPITSLTVPINPSTHLPYLFLSPSPTKTLKHKYSTNPLTYPLRQLSSARRTERSPSPTLTLSSTHAPHLRTIQPPKYYPLQAAYARHTLTAIPSHFQPPISIPILSPQSTFLIRYDEMR